MKRVFLIIVVSMGLFARVDIAKLQQEAKAGNKEALMELGFIYETGDGVEKDIQKAKKYYSAAAELGNEDAQIALSLLQLSSNLDKKSVSLTNSVTIKGSKNLDVDIEIKDLKEVIKKAKQMDKEALLTLAVLYDNGHGEIKEDKKRAIALYKKAAKLGSKKAKNILAIKGIKY